MNLQIEANWLHQNQILCYTVYSLNNEILKEWALDVLEQLDQWPQSRTPLLLFDLSNPNVSMSYFVLTQRNIFNLALTPETQPGLDKYIDQHPDVRVRLAIILSNTMAGVMSSGRGTNVLRKLTIGKVFFDRDPALTWLLAESGYTPQMQTRLLNAEAALQALEIGSMQGGGTYVGKGEIRLLVNGSLEIAPLTEERPLTIGRSSSATIDVSSHGQPAITVSRQHAQISLSNGQLTLMDLNSKNGTFIDDKRLESGKAYPISLKSEIKVGAISIRILS